MATMTADEYREIVKTIIDAATGGSASGSYPMDAFNNGNYSAQDFYDLMQTRAVKNAGYDAVLNADGSVRTYTYINKNGQIKNLGSYDDIAGAFNSNYQTGTASGGTVQFNQPIDTTLTETEPIAVKSAGTMTKYADGVKGAGNFVFGSVLPAIGAAATGIALGKTIDKTIYEVGTNIFGADNLEAFNPNTWGSITAGDDSLGAKAFNTIFGINPDNGNTQMYMDENAFTYMTTYLQNKGVFDSSLIANDTYIPIQDNYTLNYTYTNYNFTVLTNTFSYGDAIISISSDAKALSIKTNDDVGLVVISKKKTDTITINGVVNTYTARDSITTIDNINYYRTYYNPIRFINGGAFSGTSLIVNAFWNDATKPDYMQDYALLLFNQNFIESGMDGVATQENAKIPNISSSMTQEEVLNALKSQYPELWDNRVENNVVQPDGTTKTYTYIPVPMPTGGTADKPTTEGAKQSQPAVDPSTATDTLLNTLVQILTQTKPVGMTDTPTDPINPNPPDIGGGDTPVVIVPTGSANALYSIYNPSQSQLNSFGAWLWSSDFVDQLLKMFSDPMQAIIGLHKIFASPSISGAGPIKVGYLDSGVSSNIVGNQYTTIDCGSVNLYEYYGNVFDYDPFTKINLYLPFIGIVPLNVGEIMRSAIHIIYHIDVLTGACLAEVKINRDSAGGTLFQYSGNAAVQYPISSGSYMSIISGIMSIAGGIAGTVATGGAAMPVLLGAGASVGRMHTDISHSGGFSGNAGAMGIKKPYLIIDRPQTALAKNFPNYIGYPSNSTITLSGCKGFTKVKEVHLENIPATNNELTDIESKLKGGVII